MNNIPTILVVEDNLADQFVLKELLLRYDYDAKFVRTGEEAVIAAGVTNFVGIILDLTLGGMDGFECIKHFRRLDKERGRHTPVIAVTARADVEDREACLKAGMDAYLSKPYEPEELRKILLRHIYVENSPNLKLLDNGSTR